MVDIGVAAVCFFGMTISFALRHDLLGAALVGVSVGWLGKFTMTQIERYYL
jgi:hypothetical protein